MALKYVSNHKTLENKVASKKLRNILHFVLLFKFTRKSDAYVKRKKKKKNQILKHFLLRP